MKQDYSATTYAECKRKGPPTKTPHETSAFSGTYKNPYPKYECLPTPPAFASPRKIFPPFVKQAQPVIIEIPKESSSLAESKKKTPIQSETESESDYDVGNEREYIPLIEEIKLIPKELEKAVTVMPIEQPSIPLDEDSDDRIQEEGDTSTESESDTVSAQEE